MSSVSNIESKKKKLTQASEAYKRGLNKNIGDTIGSIERGVVTTAIVGGSLFVGYKFLQRLLSSEEKPKRSAPKDSKNAGKPAKSKKKKKNGDKQDPEAGIIQAGLQTVALFALAILREKIVEYIEETDTDE